jgi:hypothetical protein
MPTLRPCSLVARVVILGVTIAFVTGLFVAGPVSVVRAAGKTNSHRY